MAKMRQAITKKRAAPAVELVEDAMFAGQESYEESDEFEALPMASPMASNQAQVSRLRTDTGSNGGLSNMPTNTCTPHLRLPPPKSEWSGLK